MNQKKLRKRETRKWRFCSSYMLRWEMNEGINALGLSLGDWTFKIVNSYFCLTYI